MKNALLLILPFAVACSGTDGGPSSSQSASETAGHGPGASPALDESQTASSDALRADGGGFDTGVIDAGPPDIGVPDGSGFDAGQCWSYLSPKEPRCDADLALFDKARSFCKQDGTFLNQFTANESCGSGSSTGYGWTCCTTKPSCGAGGGMGGPKCATDTTFFESAESSCNGSIAEFHADQSTCRAHSAKSASFVCSCL